MAISGSPRRSRCDGVHQLSSEYESNQSDSDSDIVLDSIYESPIF